MSRRSSNPNLVWWGTIGEWPKVTKTTLLRVNFSKDRKKNAFLAIFCTNFFYLQTPPLHKPRRRRHLSTMSTSFHHTLSTTYSTTTQNSMNTTASASLLRSSPLSKCGISSTKSTSTLKKPSRSRLSTQIHSQTTINMTASQWPYNNNIVCDAAAQGGLVHRL